jgi:hypothetical protein
MKRLLTVLAGVGLLVALAPPAVSGAAADTADTSFPIDEATQLEMHTRVDCKLATKQCDFFAGANLRTPDGPTGFPPDLWARQTTEMRSMDRLSYLNAQVDGNFFTKEFKEGGSNAITTIYFGAGPVDKYQITGTINPVSWQSGQPKTDADVIVCAQIQVVYAGVNITSPSTCSQTTFS